MREIKFRGKTIGGLIVFGSYYYENLDDIGEIPIIMDEHGEENVVYPESVAQLVGYDANGKEVYEGDKLIDRDGRRIKAALRPNFTSIAVLDEANDD